MKTVSKFLGRCLRLGAVAPAILISQYAFAAGTDPGVLVENTADISYEVNSNPFTEPSTAADFVVDRRVDFTITRLGTGLTPTGLGDDNVFVDFVVMNLSNGDLDLSLVAAQVASGTTIYPGEDDNVDTVIDSIEVSAAIDTTPGSGDGPAPIYGAGLTFINDLPEDQSIRVRVYTDTPTTLSNGDIAGVELFATAADPAGPPEVLLTESASWNAGTIDNVFANASGADTSGNATESALDGFIVESPQLVITKVASVISDPINGVSPNARAIPGAIVEYLITIDNSAGDDSADAVSIADELDTDVVFQNGANNPYNGGASNIVFDQGLGTESFCDADDAGDTNTDGCSIGGAPLALALDGRDDSVGPIVPIVVAAGATVTVRFQVEIL